MLHNAFLIFKFRPHLELEWLCTSIGLFVAAAITLDATTIILAIIAFLSTVITSYFTYLMARTQIQLKDTKVAIDQQKVVVDDYHKSVNSKMDKLLEVVKAAALAEGHLAGVREEKLRKGTEEADFLKGKDATKLEVKLDIPPEIKKKLDIP